MAAKKPAYKCTESWVTLLVGVLGALMASGMLADTQAGQLIGSILAVAGTFGYTHARVANKKTEAENGN